MSFKAVHDGGVLFPNNNGECRIMSDFCNVIRVAQSLEPLVDTRVVVFISTVWTAVVLWCLVFSEIFHFVQLHFRLARCWGRARFVESISVFFVTGGVRRARFRQCHSHCSRFREMGRCWSCYVFQAFAQATFAVVKSDLLVHPWWKVLERFSFRSAWHFRMESDVGFVNRCSEIAFVVFVTGGSGVMSYFCNVIHIAQG